ncbi:MAG TPA: DUF2946 family protein, partial [Lysobacter sp.]|nr:DUF2946 family protein [Lysobacter sp.]
SAPARLVGSIPGDLRRSAIPTGNRDLGPGGYPPIMSAVIRSRSFHRSMSRLALVALLMLLLLPATGRVLGAASQSDGVWAQMCTMTGLQLVKIPLGDVDPGAPRPSGDMPMDCAYCPLLAALTMLVLWVVLAFPQLAGQRLAAFGPVPRNGRGHPSGLGSRGPPVAL